jgi:hypothetical protein
MDIEARLRKLESRYRSALNAVIAAKAHYLALVGAPTAERAEIDRAKTRWQQLDARKCSIGVQLGELEELNNDAAA